MNVQEYLDRLKSLGCHFLIEIPNESGVESHFLTVPEVRQFHDDPTAIYAKKLDVTKEQYSQWHEEGCSARCAGITRKGRRCRNTVPGGSLVNARRWVELQGEYCVLHAGE